MQPGANLYVNYEEDFSHYSYRYPQGSLPCERTKFSPRYSATFQSDVNFDSANGFGLTNKVFSLELKLINWLLSNLAGASFVRRVNFHCPTEVMFTGCSCSYSEHS